MRLNIIPDEINLLYIEGDEKIVEIISKYLKSFRHTKFNVIHKRTLKEGIDFLCEECSVPETAGIDIILLDLMLPNSTGIETFINMKKQCDFLPIVIISEHEDIACKCVKEGAQDYLIKEDLSAGILVRSLKYSIQRNRLESEFKGVIRSSTLGYLIYRMEDGELIFTGYNPAANAILDFDCSEFIGKKIQEAFPRLPHDLIEKYKRILTYNEKMTTQILEYEDENVSSASFRFNAYKSNDQLVVTFEDISEQMKLQHELEDRETKYRNLVEVTGAGIYGIDFVNNKFTYVNDVMCEQLGYTREELLELGPSDVLTEYSLLLWAERFAALGRGEYIEDTVEYEAVKKDGTIIWVLVTAEYIEDDNKNIIGANVVAIDITERKLTKEALQKKEIEVYSQLESKIHKWKEEIEQRSFEKSQRLRLIDSEILSMTKANNSLEVS